MALTLPSAAAAFSDTPVDHRALGSPRKRRLSAGSLFLGRLSGDCRLPDRGCRRRVKSQYGLVDLPGVTGGDIQIAVHLRYCPAVWEKKRWGNGNGLKLQGKGNGG